LLFVELVNGLLVSNIVESDNTIGNSLSFNELDPPNFSSTVAMSTTASFGINTLNVNNSEGVSWNYTTLIKMETMLLLGFSLVHEGFVDGGAIVNDSVSIILDGLLFLLGQTLIMSDIQVSHFGGLFGTMLPNVWTQDLSAGGIDDMGSSVMSHKLPSSICINGNFNLLTLEHFKVAFKRSVENVENTLSYLNGINDLIFASATLDLHDCGIVLLSTRSWINSRLVKNDNVWHVLLLNILINFDDGSLELHKAGIPIVHVISLCKMTRVIKDYRSLFSGLFCFHGDLIVETLWDCSLGDLGNLISCDTVRLHTDDPVIEGKLSFFLFDDLFELLDGFVIGESPSVVLNLDDITETLVFWELAEDSLQIELVLLEDFKETFHANFVPPSVFLHDTEASSEDVPDISTASNIGRESTIRDGDKDSSSVIENDIELLDRLNTSFNCLGINSNRGGDVGPSFINIIKFIDVESAGVWSEFSPEFLVDHQLELLGEIGESIEESVLIRSWASVDDPSDSLETNTGIDDLDVKLLSGTIVESLVLHEDHVSDLHTFHEVLDGGAKVTATSPNILDESDFISGNVEGLGEPSEVEFDDLVFEEFVVVWVVKDLDTKHDETRVMTACNTDIIQIIESGTELWANQWVSWWIKFSSDAIWLEAENTSSNEVDIISPSGDDWISVDGSARDSCGSEALLETFPSVCERNFFAVFAEAIADE